MPDSLPPTIHDDALDYFARDSDNVQLRRLTAAVPGFVRVPTVDPLSYDLWSTKAIFDESLDTESRYSRLCAGRRRIDQGSEEYACAVRLYYIFLEHEFEELTSLFCQNISASTSTDKTHVRETTKNRVYREITTGSLFTPRSLSNDRTHGRHYNALLKEVGPGDLLDLGDDTSTL